MIDLPGPTPASALADRQTPFHLYCNHCFLHLHQHQHLANFQLHQEPIRAFGRVQISACCLRFGMLPSFRQIPRANLKRLTPSLFPSVSHPIRGLNSQAFVHDPLHRFRRPAHVSRGASLRIQPPTSSDDESRMFCSIHGMEALMLIPWLSTLATLTYVHSGTRQGRAAACCCSHSPAFKGSYVTQSLVTTATRTNRQRTRWASYTYCQ